ncbi:hypothetical protein C0J52_22773 [Blattella germanica]|nr:hypothetical protein C0J52_22773 [Blattella germanica]
MVVGKTPRASQECLITNATPWQLKRTSCSIVLQRWRELYRSDADVTGILSVECRRMKTQHI